MANRVFIILVLSIFLDGISAENIDARILTQMTPSLTVSNEYRDNYFKTELNRQEQFISTYQLGFSLAFLDKQQQIYLNYFPKYIDYDTFDNRDSFAQAFRIDGAFQPFRHADIDLTIGYDGQKDTPGISSSEIQDSSSWNGSIDAGYQLFEHTALYSSWEYSKSTDQQIRTGEYKQHSVNKIVFGGEYQFGKKDYFELNYSFSQDDYNDPDQDEYQAHKFSLDISYWFLPLVGMEAAMSFENMEYKYSFDDPDTLAGHIRFIRKLSRQFDYYIKYAQTYTRQVSGNHMVYHPSIGFDWNVDEDSGISIGAGVLIERWDQSPGSDSDDFFIDLDIYKDFHFSPRGTVSINASSGYTETSPTASSLGFNIYYQAGILFNYLLTRHLSCDLGSSYHVSSFSEPDLDRKDRTFESNAGISWTPLKWMTIDLSYYFTQFDTNSEIREDYNENRAVFSINFTPQTPLKMKEN